MFENVTDLASAAVNLKMRAVPVVLPCSVIVAPLAVAVIAFRTSAALLPEGSTLGAVKVTSNSKALVLSP